MLITNNNHDKARGTKGINKRLVWVKTGIVMVCISASIIMGIVKNANSKKVDMLPTETYKIASIADEPNDFSEIIDHLIYAGQIDSQYLDLVDKSLTGFQENDPNMDREMAFRKIRDFCLLMIKAEIICDQNLDFNTIDSLTILPNKNLEQDRSDSYIVEYTSNGNKRQITYSSKEKEQRKVYGMLDDLLVLDATDPTEETSSKPIVRIYNSICSEVFSGKDNVYENAEEELHQAMKRL